MRRLTTWGVAATRAAARRTAAAAARWQATARAGRNDTGIRGAARTRCPGLPGRIDDGARAAAGSDYWLARCPKGLEAARTSLPMMSIYHMSPFCFAFVTLLCRLLYLAH